MAILDTLKEILENSLRKTVRTTEEQIGRIVSYQVKKVTSYLMSQLIFFSIMTIALILLILAAIFAGIEYLHLTATLSFLIIGIFLLFIALIVRVVR